jgi:small subunit ribosomal protein S17
LDTDTTTNEARQPGRGHQVLRVGVVDSLSGRKTVRVVFDNLVKHRLYGKYMRRRSKLLAHDEQGAARVGDTVEIAQCRPISKRKSWRLVRVLKRLEPPESSGPEPR